MSNIVTFQDKEIEVIHLCGEDYLTQSGLATALNYRNRAGISEIYKTYKDEFDESMTRLIRMPTGSSKNNTTAVRVFNRRGAWLIGMFSRTPVAKEFRKWVLDVLEEKTLPVEQKQAVQQQLPSPHTEADKMMLASIIEKQEEALVRMGAIGMIIKQVPAYNQYWQEMIVETIDSAKRKIASANHYAHNMQGTLKLERQFR